MSLTEFVKAYLKEKGLKLATHQKGMLKSIQEGKMSYSPGRTVGKSVLESMTSYLPESTSTFLFDAKYSKIKPNFDWIENLKDK